MIITLSGANDYARRAEQSRFVGEFEAAHGKLSLERLDGEEAEYERIAEALTSLPFLANKKMVVLAQPSASKAFAEHAEELLAGMPETTDLLLVEPKFDRRSSLYKLLKKVTDYREYANLEGPQLTGWLVEQAKSQGATLGRDEAQYLIERVGASQQLLANELDKLCLQSGPIDRTTIDQLTEPTPQSTIFQLIDAAMAGNRRQALQLYAEQRRLKIEPQQIVAMFAWQLHVLAVVRAAGDRSADDIARAARLNPYTVRKTQNIARRIDITSLRRVIAELLSIDRRSKRSNIDLDDSLQYFILSLAA